MSAIESEIYFRVRVWRRYLFKKVDMYLHAKFRRYISIHGWDKTTFGIENGQPPYWNSTSSFDFDLCVIMGISFCICLPNFIVIGRSSSCPLFKKAAGSQIGFDVGNVRAQRCHVHHVTSVQSLFAKSWTKLDMSPKCVCPFSTKTAENNWKFLCTGKVWLIVVTWHQKVQMTKKLDLSPLCSKQSIISNSA